MKREDYIEEISKNGVYVVQTLGNSMWPILKSGKQKVAVTLKKERLKPLDVAFYERKDGSCVLHRVIEVSTSGYYFCGDSQLRLEKVSEDMVFAVMQGYFTNKGYVDANDEKYIKKVEKWYSSPKKRRRKLKFFYLRNKILGIFKRREKENG